MKIYRIFFFIITFIFSQGEGGVNVDLLGYLSFEQNTSDITGFYQDGREFVAIGLQNSTAIVDVSEPTNPYEINRISGGNSMWRDLKYYERHVYIGTEADDGVKVVSVDNPDNPVLVHTIDDFGNSHNIHIDDDGFLYVVGTSGGCDIWIYNLENPSSPIQEGCWNGEYIHDLEVYNNKAYASGIYSGVFYIIDVSDKSNPDTMLSYQTASGGQYSTHDAAVTFDENYLIIADESPGAIISIYDISDYSNINKISEYYTSGYDGDGYLYRSSHNVYIQESSGLLITSYYIDGTRIIDISDPSSPIEIGYYDTSEGDLASQGDPYYGNWGTYVDLPSGNIVSSDIENGLFILGYNNAELSYNPENIEISINDNEIVNGQFSITNTGEEGSILNYTLSVSPFENSEGGPDNFDTFWSDSDSETDILYNWTDISNEGILYNFPGNDESGISINLGFSFPFYGELYTSIIINANGWVGFENDNNGWENESIPSNTAPGSAIFGFWDDLNPINDNCNSYCSGDVYYHTNNDRMVIWFNEVAHWWTNFENSFYDFQIIIYSTGDIMINYRSLSGISNSATIGIQNALGDTGLQVSFDDQYAHNNLSLIFRKSPEWIEYISSITGELESEETSTINYAVNSSSLSTGEYTSYLKIDSNAGKASIPLLLLLNSFNDVVFGDVNFDGLINILDIVNMINFVIDLTQPTDQEFYASDINMDLSIDVLDIVLIINIILDS